MKPPGSVKIGYRDYEIRFQPKDIKESDDFGECLKNEAVILIHEPQRLQDKAETLLHEACHAIWNAADLPDKATEEQAVKALSKGLAGVFRDNPEAIKWILAGLKAK